MARRSGRTCGRSYPRARRTPAAPDPAQVERFAADLDRLLPAGSMLGVAVSGGPDSLALLLLASAARPGQIQAATVDHALRTGSSAEAEMAADICSSMGVPHSTLTVDWQTKPETAIQERARLERYRLLGQWAERRRLAAIATGHHLDDQAETLLMRLDRGAGVSGLAAMRAAASLPDGSSTLPLLRPLLGWRRSELADICRDAGVTPAQDPSNSDEQFERVRIRRGLAAADWLDPEAIARSAANLASADEALEWAVEREWQSQVSRTDGDIRYRPRAPLAVRQRIVRRAVSALATEGGGNEIRGRELDQLVTILLQGGTGTLRGVRCSGGDDWRFAPAPARRPTG